MPCWSVSGGQGQAWILCWDVRPLSGASNMTHQRQVTLTSSKLQGSSQFLFLKRNSKFMQNGVWGGGANQKAD